MGICKECLHFEVCNSWHKELEEEGLATGGFFQHKCKDFKNKSDLQEVKHGEWIYCPETINLRSHFCCSACNGIRLEHYVKNNFRYCPNCGAKMDGKGV